MRFAIIIVIVSRYFLGPVIGYFLIKSVLIFVNTRVELKESV